LKTFLNFENSLGFENIFKTKAHLKQSCHPLDTSFFASAFFNVIFNCMSYVLLFIDLFC